MRKITLFILLSIFIAGCSGGGDTAGSQNVQVNVKGMREQFLTDEAIKVKAKSVAECDKIKIQSVKTDCEVLVITNSAIELRDETKCNAITNSESQAQCRNTVNIFASQK